jgi:catechol 2,3-dioxygenase-like lactoylglutathione lyase family enzyme
MLDHIDFAVSDFSKSREFYVQVLAPLGVEPIMDIKRGDGREGTGFGIDSFPQFWIGGGSAVSERLHVAFTAESRAAVDNFHNAVVAAGGTSKGLPGLRPRYGEHYYASYVCDLDGHTIEAVCRRPD